MAVDGIRYLEPELLIELQPSGDFKADHIHLSVTYGKEQPNSPTPSLGHVTLSRAITSGNPSFLYFKMRIVTVFIVTYEEDSVS